MSALLIDAGNSRIKWRWQGRIQYCRYDDFAEQAWPEAEQVVLASVRQLPQLEQWLRQRYDELVVLHAPLRSYSSFIHCYDKPERLGVDRWLAMLGAAETVPSANDRWLVIDAGTALTVDLLERQQQQLLHQGGYIVPGLALAQSALFNHAERVCDYTDEVPATDFLPGTDTLGCVSAGVRCQQLALLQHLSDRYPTAELVVSGGDGAWLAQAKGCRFTADLVFDGMEHLCAGSFFS